MNCHKLDQVKEEKDLGVLIDNELKFQTNKQQGDKKRLGIVKKNHSHILDSITTSITHW